MAVQKSKKSKSKKLQRRSHQSLTNPTLSTDVVTGERHLRHQMTADGFYRGKKIVDIKKPEEEPVEE
jgi:large subunit ribosomal protein L32|tara:strand:- start:807 stop:1007 length:201 start_codon:yes stop_codon:yes gene_type:complete